jgi:hypothetical protein
VSGTYAARQRTRSSVHSLGKYSSRSMRACPAPVAQAAIPPHLTREDTAQRAGVLVGDPGRGLAALGEPRLVHHQHPAATRAGTLAVVSESADDVAAGEVP